MTGAEFREARKRLGLTQEQCAMLFGMRQPNFSRYENVERVPNGAATLMRVLVFCNEHGLSPRAIMMMLVRARRDD